MVNIRPYLTLDSFVAFVILFVLFFGLFTNEDTVSFWHSVVIVSVIVGSLPYVYSIAIALLEGRFGVDSIAIMAIIFALFTDEVVAAGVVLLMLSGGATLEKYAENRARYSLEKLLRRAPQKASVYKDGAFKITRISEVQVGDILGIKKGEVIPVDGVVHKGVSYLDESMITGESGLRDVMVNDIVMSGAVNMGEFFEIKATTTYEKSIFAGIVRLVNEAEKEKPKTVRMADRYSVYFTVFTFSLATLALFKDPKLATAVLVVATPCPLILAAPIAFIAGMSRAARNGIIVKRGGVFEIVSKVRAFFFDKTGTLTLGSPSIHRIYSYLHGVSESDILRFVASLEQVSNHILAESILQRAKMEKIKLLPVSRAKETIGGGIVGMIDGREYCVGNLAFLKSYGVIVLDNDRKNQSKSKPTVYIARGKQYLGKIIFTDAIRRNAKEVIHDLSLFQGKSEIILLTGDSKERAREVGKTLGIHQVMPNCLPKDKLSLIEHYERRGNTVAMIGDGVNDSPSLAKASVGIALSTHGATVATDIADVVIVANDLDRITLLTKISLDTVRIAKQSMGVGMGLSILAMVVAYLGYLPPIQGAILQEGIDILVIINALRAL